MKVIKKDLGTFKVFAYKKKSFVQKPAGKSGPVHKHGGLAER